jgi:hypothetical protein
MKLPAFQFYPGDWRKDPAVQSLDYTERGIWVELLCLMHESNQPGKLMIGGQPYPEDRLARLLGLSPEVMSKVISTLITLGVASRCPETGALTCLRMIRDRETIKKRADCGKLGGNPNFQKGAANPYYSGDKQKDNQDHKQRHKQKITPSSSSSVSSSEDLGTAFAARELALEIEPTDKPAKPAKTTKPRPRNPEIDALVALDGSDPNGATSAAFAAAGTALRDIKQVSPDVTAAEINRRASNYRERFRDAAISPMALAKHWAAMDRLKSGCSAAPVATSIPEPDDWRAFLNQERPESVYAEGGNCAGTPWAELGQTVQKWILAEMHKYNATTN